MKSNDKKFEKLVAEYQAEKKCSKGRAISAIAREYPDEHQEFIKRMNRPQAKNSSGGRFEALVADKIKSGLSRGQAIKEAVSEYPAAHEDYIARLQTGERGDL